MNETMVNKIKHKVTITACVKKCFKHSQCELMSYDEATN